MPEPAARTGPGPAIRLPGRTVNAAVARFPWAWRLAGGPVRRFFDSIAPRWASASESTRSSTARR